MGEMPMDAPQELSAGRALIRPGHEPAAVGVTVSIADGAITAVRGDPARADDGLLLLPALVDAHDHGRGLRTLDYGVDDQALELWLPLLGLEPRIDPYLRAGVAFARMAEGGIGAANHCHNPQDPRAIVKEAEGVARAARDVGIRVAFAVPLRDRNPFAYGDPAPVAKALGDDFKTLADAIPRYAIDEQMAWIDAIAAFEHPLFQVQYGAVGPQWCSDKLLAAVAEGSARTGRRVHMHLFETQRQREWADATYPGGLIRHLDAIGFLSDRLTLAHGVWLNPDECALLGERGVTVSVNTSSNLRLGSGIASAAAFKKAGLAWAMGLDGLAFDDDDDGFREIRLLWVHQKGTGIAPAISRAELGDAVFVNGRRTVTPALGGAIMPGMAADLVVLDRKRLAGAMLDGASGEMDLLLARGRREFVRDVVIAGRRIVSGGVVRSVDLSALEAELTAQARAAWPKAKAATALRHRYRDALARFYACGCHRAPPLRSDSPGA